MRSCLRFARTVQATECCTFKSRFPKASQGSVVGILTALPAGRSKTFKGALGCFSGIKRSRRETTHSPYSAEAKNRWSHRPISATPICLHGIDRDNFFYFFPIFGKDDKHLDNFDMI